MRGKPKRKYEQYNRRHDHKRALSANQVLVLSTPFEIVTLRQRAEVFAQHAHGVFHRASEITLTYSIYMLANGCTAPFAGQLIDRLGARVTYGLGVLSLGLGYFLAGYATHIVHYYICIGLLGGIGAASLGMVAASSLLSRWFVDRIDPPLWLHGHTALVRRGIDDRIATHGGTTFYNCTGSTLIELLPPDSPAEAHVE